MISFLNSIKRRVRNYAAQPVAASYAEVERAEQIFYLEYLREGMTIFDVGANVGELTLLFSRFTAGAGGGIVHAFEPSRAAFERLEIVCRAANRQSVVLNNLALSDKSGFIRLHVYADDYLSFNSQAARPMKDYGLDIEPVGIEEIRATTVDDYCDEKGIERIDLLKIDTEGAELQVMKGARKMLKSGRVKCMTFEFGQTTFDMGNRPEEIEDFLAEMNYNVRNIVRGNPVFPGRESIDTAKFSMHAATPRA
jgi:FkbM family methyltransferase